MKFVHLTYLNQRNDNWLRIDWMTMKDIMGLDQVLVYEILLIVVVKQEMTTLNCRIYLHYHLHFLYYDYYF